MYIFHKDDKQRTQDEFYWGKNNTYCTFLISLYSSSCNRGKLESINAYWENAENEDIFILLYFTSIGWNKSKKHSNNSIIINNNYFPRHLLQRQKEYQAHTSGIRSMEELTLMILFRHSSATILTSDSLSSLHNRNISMAIPRSFWNSGDVLVPQP